MKYDLVVAYRIYPLVSKATPIFQEDKIALSRFCLESFKRSLTGLRVKVFAILDGCNNEYEKLFTDNFNNNDLEIIRTPCIGNKATFERQINILIRQNDSDIVYFAEDDYFYIENINSMIEIIKTGKADFITPYNHPMYYSNCLHDFSKKIILLNNKDWMEVKSTCLTFMTSKTKLKLTKDYFLVFSKKAGFDTAIWFGLTQGWGYFRYVFRLFILDRGAYLNLFVCLLFFWKNIFFNKKYKLYSPILTIATHVESENLSPEISWKKYFYNF